MDPSPKLPLSHAVPTPVTITYGQEMGPAQQTADLLRRGGCPHRPAWLADGGIACGLCGAQL